LEQRFTKIPRFLIRIGVLLFEKITLSEALQLSLTMEEAGVEAYFQEVMRGESSNDALNYVRQFYNDSEHHADVIKEFKDSLE